MKIVEWDQLTEEEKKEVLVLRNKIDVLRKNRDKIAEELDLILTEQKEVHKRVRKRVLQES